jgi:N-acetylmuramoyl-L-alanine amidase
MKTIALSAGHNINDPGAVGDGLVERDLVEKIVAYASEIMRSHGVGVLNPPIELDLRGTIKWINDRKDQIESCCEVHINAGGGLGAEGWYYRNSDESKKFALFLVDAINAESGMSKSRGVKDEKTANVWGRLGFVHDTKPLACLIECGFIDRVEDRKILSTEKGLYDIAKGVARGYLSFMGVEWKPPKPQYLTQPTDYLKIKGELAESKAECQGLKERLKQIAEICKL